MRIVIRCPHCQDRAIARESIEMSALLREIIYMCMNPRCAHTYVANLEIVRTLSPSKRPNLAIELPLSSRAWARKREPTDSQAQKYRPLAKRHKVMTCPHCQSQFIARNSTKMGVLLRKITYRCVNFRCAYTCVAYLEIVQTLSPSGMPNSAIQLPLRCTSKKSEI